MTKLRCCFCQQELQEITTSNPLGLGRIEMAVCKKCMDKGVLHIMPIWDWQELIRTRKALDVSTGFIKGISQTAINDCDNQYVVLSNFKKFAQDTLEQITALEQKD